MSSQASARVLRAASSRWGPLATRLDRWAGSVFILPAVLVILGFSIFPLLASLYVSLSRLSFSEGGVNLKFVGLDNYAKLIVGVDHTHFLGVAGSMTPVTFAVLAAAYGLLALLLYRYITGPNRTAGGLVGRVISAVIAGG